MTNQSDRLTQEFDITPQAGIKLNPLPQKEEDSVSDDQALPEQPEQEIEATEEPQQDTAQSQTEEPDTEIEEQSLNMSIGQFANAAGVTLRDIYGITMPDGRTLSQAVDEGKEQQAVLSRLQKENSQLQEKLQTAQSNYVPMDDPEALALEKEAEVYQKALDNADWSQVDAGQAANQKLEYMRVISQLKDAAAQKRNENAGKQQKAANDALMAANQKLLSEIPEWNSAEVYGKDNRDMGRFLLSHNFTENDLFAIDRHPVFKHFAYKAWKAMAKQEEIKRGASKVRKISKSLGPGPAGGKSNKQSLKEVGKAIKTATRAERQRMRLNAEFDR